MSSPRVSTFQPGIVGSSIARLVLPQARRERRGDVVHLLLGRGQLEDQHVLGEPALVARHHDWRCAASSTSCRAASCRRSPSRTTRSSAPRGTGRCTSSRCTATRRRPGPARAARRRSAGTARSRRRSHPLEDVLAHPGHDPHRRDDVRGVGDLDAEHRLLGVERAHAERDDVHGPTPHAAAVEVGHDRLHLGRGHPVVRRPGVRLVDRADERPVLDAGDVGRVGARSRTSSASCSASSRTRVPASTSASGEPLPLLVGPVAPDDAAGVVSAATSSTHAASRACVVGVPVTGTGLAEVEIVSEPSAVVSGLVSVLMRGASLQGRP